jgi:uncharacterized membrane protein YcjF (UPF0283 family)
MIMSAVQELEDAAMEEPSAEGGARLNRLAVLKIGSRFGDPNIGEGVARLEAASPDITDNTVVKNLASTKLVPELDEVARKLPEEELKPFIAEVVEQAKKGNTEQLAQLVKGRLKEIRK